MAKTTRSWTYTRDIDRAHENLVTTNGSPHEQSATVAQASGMVSVQARCSVDHAMLLMRERAVIQTQTLEQIANGVIDRSLNFG